MANRREALAVEKASERYNKLERTERLFRVFLERVFPGAEISYQAESFTAPNDNGIPETTIPDFRVIRPDGKIIFIEITKERRNGIDPKERDRKIMKKAAPNSPYVVIYADTLKKIQAKYKGFDFFKSEKRKKIIKESLPEMKPRIVKTKATREAPPVPANYPKLVYRLR